MQINQYVGLNKWARAKVLAKRSAVEIGERIFADGFREPFERTVEVPLARITAVGKIEGYFDEVVADLRRFELPNGEVYEEFIEAAPCNGGPMFYTALKDSAGIVVSESLWEESTGCAIEPTFEQPDYPDWTQY